MKKRSRHGPPGRSSPRGGLLLSIVALSLAALSLTTGTGCVERLLQVRSDPPGARVWVNGSEVGVTPLDYPFGSHGEISVVLRKNGYLAYREAKELEVPWYSHFPLDVFSDLLLPWKLEDHQQVEARLAPLASEAEALGTSVALPELLETAERARATARRIEERVAQKMAPSITPTGEAVPPPER